VNALLKRNELDPDVWNLAIPYGDGTRYSVYAVLHDDVLSDSTQGIFAGHAIANRNRDHHIVTIPIVIITRERYDELAKKAGEAT